MTKEPPASLDIDDIIAGTAVVGWETARALRVMLDGAEQEQVLAYNCDEGWVRRNVLNLKGEPVIVGVSNDQRIKTETVRGDVTVQWKDGG